jgi:hypothetical protein
MRISVFFWSSLMEGSRRMSPTRSVPLSRSSRMPARTYSVSEEI